MYPAGTCHSLKLGKLRETYLAASSLTSHEEKAAMIQFCSSFMGGMMELSWSHTNISLLACEAL